MPPFHLHHQTERLKCPYNGCGKLFARPTILADSSTLPRQTYYACPHCMSKIDMIVKDLEVIGIKPLEHAGVFNSPAKCAHYSGFSNALSKDVAIPDDCLSCPKILQCGTKRT